MIHVILVNYNGTDDTIACVGSLRRMNGDPFTVTIVDNASKSDQSHALKLWGETLDPIAATDLPSVSSSLETLNGEVAGFNGPIKITIVFSATNLGFAGGNNIGIAMALADTAMTHVWVLNNDTEVAVNALPALVDRMAEDPGVGMCGSTLVYFDNRAVVQALGGRFNARLGRPEQISALIALGDLPRRDTVESELAYVIGASMLVSRAYLAAVGPMDESYFLYFEEIDWAMRGKGRFRLAWAPESIVYHKEGGAIGTSSRGRPSDISLHYMTISTLKFLSRHYHILLPIGLGRLGIMAARYFLRGDRQAALVICRSIVQFSQGRPDAIPHTP